MEDIFSLMIAGGVIAGIFSVLIFIVVIILVLTSSVLIILILFYSFKVLKKLSKYLDIKIKKGY